MRNQNISSSTLQSFVQCNHLSNKGLNQTELQELFFLVEEAKEQNIRSSSALSRYIKENKLGRKYSHIAGTVKMQNSESQWDFKGGFPPKIYAIVCTILGFTQKGSRAWVVGYETYSQSRAAY
jgi:hypothetical protein